MLAADENKISRRALFVKAKYLKYSIFSLIVFLAFIGVFSILIFSLRFSDRSKETGIPVHSDSTTVENNELFTIEFEQPNKIYGSPYYFTELNFKNLQSQRSKYTGYENSTYYWGKSVNLIFFDPKSDNCKLLFNHPVIITKLYYPDTEHSVIKSKMIYQAIFNDTNSDGIINNKDNTVLFISDIFGDNLKQITPDTLTVDSYRFMDDKNGLMIISSIPDFKNGVKEAYWEKRIYWYNFEREELSTNKRFIELLKISKEILNIHE